MEEKEHKIAKLRQYYFERYESLQYQLMVISGGTLTVFISLNKDTPQLLYKYGFSMLGCSLILGVLSIFCIQVHLFFATELQAIDTKTDEVITKNEKKGIDYMKRFISKDYLVYGNFFTGFLQFCFFVIGLILILVGLTRS